MSAKKKAQPANKRPTRKLAAFLGFLAEDAKRHPERLGDVGELVAGDEELYEAYARDPERRAVARADQQELLRGGVIGRAKKATKLSKLAGSMPPRSGRSRTLDALRQEVADEGALIARATGAYAEPPEGSETRTPPFDASKARRV